MVTFELNEAVTVKGVKSNNDGRLRAGGKIIAVHPNGRYDVEAYVQGHGLQHLVGLRASDLVKALAVNDKVGIKGIQDSLHPRLRIVGTIVEKKDDGTFVVEVPVLTDGRLRIPDLRAEHLVRVRG